MKRGGDFLRSRSNQSGQLFWEKIFVMHQAIRNQTEDNKRVFNRDRFKPNMSAGAHTE